MNKLVFLEDKKSVIWATADDRDSRRGSVICPPGTVGFGALGSSEKQMREAFDLYRKHTGQSEPRAQTWIQFDPTNPPAPGDYWCEVPALKLRYGGCLCRALYWTGERWEGPGGEYEVGKYVPEALPQLHGRGVVCEIDEGRDQWRLDAAIAHVRELEKARDRAVKLFELVSAERNELVRRANELERLICDMAGTEYDSGHSPADTIRSLRERLGAAIARAEDADERIQDLDKYRQAFNEIAQDRDVAVARIRVLEHERDSMALRIERLSVELAKPEDQRLREVTEAMAGRSVMFDDIAERVRQELHELGRWIERAGKAERELSEIRRMHSEPHDALCRDHMHTRTRDEHNCSKEAIAALRRQTSTQEDSHNEQVGMVGTMRGLPK